MIEFLDILIIEMAGSIWQQGETKCTYFGDNSSKGWNVAKFLDPFNGRTSVRPTLSQLEGTCLFIFHLFTLVALKHFFPWLCADFFPRHIAALQNLAACLCTKSTTLYALH